jgi:DNA repair protein RecO (recombination protein O)
LFRLFTAWLERLESSTCSQAETVADRRFFEINLLNILGYRPAIEHCSGCGEEYDQRGARVLSNGELACHSCARTGRNISREALSLMQLSLKTGSFGLIQPTNDALYENGRLLDEALAHHAGRSIRSLAFLQQVGDMQNMP